MNKKLAMSALGYAIVLVIILGVVMIISAPMLADKYKTNQLNTDDGDVISENNSNSETRRSYRRNRSSSSVPVGESSADDSYSAGTSNMVDIASEIRRIEDRMENRIRSVERNQQELMQRNANNASSVSNKYVCSIEGTLDADNNVIPIDSSSDLKSQKFVFVCEYRQ